MHRLIATTLSLFLLSGIAESQTDNLERFAAGGSPDRTPPFSDSVRVGDFLYLSGKLGTGQGGLVSGGITAETRQALENISTSLNRAGSSIANVVKCTVFLIDMNEFGAMNQVYVSYFRDHLPARSAVGVSDLALDARIEIECIAAIPQD